MPGIPVTNAFTAIYDGTTTVASDEMREQLRVIGTGAATVSVSSPAGVPTLTVDVPETPAQVPPNSYFIGDGGYASLEAAVAALGSTPATVEYSTDQTLTGNFSSPTTLEIIPRNGAKIIHGAYTVAYAGSTARWPLAQVFDGTGSVSNLAESQPEWFGSVGDGVTNDTVAVSKAFAAATTVYLNKTYLVSIVSSTKAVKLRGPGKLTNNTINSQLLAFLSGTESGVEVVGAKLGPMPAGSADDFAAVFFEDAKNPVVALNEITNPNTGIRFGYTTGDRTTDGLALGNHISSSESMGIENINSRYGRIIGNSIENGGVSKGIHGIRVSGTTKGIIAAANNIRDKRNIASFQVDSENAILVGNYGENLLYGYEDTATGPIDGRHLIAATIIKDATVDAFDLSHGKGYRVDGMVDGAAGQGFITSTAATDGLHRIDLTIRDTGSTSANIRNGKNIVTIIVDGTLAGTPVSIGGSNNIVHVLVTNTALNNTVYITGSNNIVTISETGTATVGLRIDGNGNIVTGRVSGTTSVQGDSNNLRLYGAALTIGAGADNNQVSGTFIGTITNSGTGNDLSGIFRLPVGSSVASAATIAPTGRIFHVTGTTPVSTITLPYTGFTGTITIIPDEAFTTSTAGNIGISSTAVVGRQLIMTYDGTKWYPNY